MASSIEINAQLRFALALSPSDKVTAPILVALTEGSTTPTLAGRDLMSVLDSQGFQQDIDAACTELSNQLIRVALDYPFLQAHISSLITAIWLIPSTETTDRFLDALARDVDEAQEAIRERLLTQPEDKLSVQQWERIQGLQAMIKAALTKANAYGPSANSLEIL